MRRLLAVDGGSFFHRATYTDPRFARYFADIVHIRALEKVNLTTYDAILLPCRIDADLLASAGMREALAAYLTQGGTVIALAADQAQGVLPGIVWRETNVDVWWWLEPDADSGIRIVAPDHPFFRAVDPDALIWHHYGLLRPPAGAVSLADTVLGGSILYLDQVSTPGRMLISTLDPIFHHGSHFMPAASRLLADLLPWIVADDGLTTLPAPVGIAAI